MKPVCYFLIGVPGSGKSTWVKPLLERLPNIAYISSDEFIEDRAERVGKTYGEIFEEEIRAATANMHSQLDDAIKHHRDIIWDQTNLSVKSRAAKLARLKNYHVWAVTFEIPVDELYRRLDCRQRETGKVIPFNVLESMLKSYEKPTLEEGFFSVVTIVV
jgi:predicted kinase